MANLVHTTRFWNDLQVNETQKVFRNSFSHFNFRIDAKYTICIKTVTRGRRVVIV